MEIGNPTSFNPGGTPSENIDVTGLPQSERDYIPGLRALGQASMTLLPDPKDPSHVRLYQLSVSNDIEDQDLTFAVGWSDGAAAPAVNSAGDDFDLPSTRTWFVFRGYISDFPFDFAVNSAVSTQMTIQRRGAGQWIIKT